MAATSEIILSNQTHTGDSSTIIVTGDNFKGDGYYSRTDGFHTVQIAVNEFIGTVNIQATLATTPVDADWFDIVTHTAADGDAERTGSFLYNFTGNYVWIRAVAEYTDGAITSILLNH